ncbi:hypothetical protein M0657_008969 [Pyricularia oryzae]|nr:hypothetical protein M0657_008969 [Pyricularia oryzae]KAI7916704.1 hypothetical protein M9X92_007753 [Pyricularia oryzae]
MPHIHRSGIVSRFPQVRAWPLAPGCMSNPPHTRHEVPLQRLHARNDMSSPACHASSAAAAVKATYASANRYAKPAGVVGDGVTFVAAPRC